MSRKRWTSAAASVITLLFVFFFGVTAPPSYSTPSPDVTLETKWELRVQGNPLSFSFAVCPDGALYALHGGRVQTVSADGKAMGKEFPVEAGIHAVACDGAHKLFVAREYLSIYQPDAHGNVSRIWSAHMKVPIIGIVVAPDSSIYGMTNEEAPAIVLISPSGKEALLKKEVRAFLLTPKLMIHSCDMVWDRARNRLGYTLPGESHVEFIEMPQPNLKKTYGNQSYEPAAQSCGVFGGRQLVTLPNGNFFQAVIDNSEIAPALSRTYLEVLDGDFKILERLPAPPRTLLIGSASDGSLYFSSFQSADGNSVTVSKRVLQENSEGAK